MLMPNPDSWYRLMVRLTGGDDLTSPTPRDLNDDSTSPRFGTNHNASNNLFVRCGVGRGQTNRTNVQPSTSAPRFGQEVGRGAGRGERYFHPYRRPAGTDQTLASTRRRPVNGNLPSPIINLGSDGEEVEEEEENVSSENINRSNDDRQSSFIERLINRRRLVFEINNRYAESLIRRQIDALGREHVRLRVECHRLTAQLNRWMDLS